MPLADLQHQIRDAVVTGNGGPSATLLIGGQHATKRLDIHRRQYETSLTAAVVGRFPATGWLVGPGRLGRAARQFVHEDPPTSPCIAEYGAAFPAFLATWPDTAHLTYVPEFADLDWQLGRLAVAVDVAAIGRQSLAGFDPMDLAGLAVTLQPGTRYVEVGWAIDRLMTMYLTEASPESWTLIDEKVRLEVRGARGSFRFSRLSAGDFAFRTALAAGLTLGDAASRALELDPAFNPGAAFLTLLDEQLMTSIGPSQTEDQS